MKLFKRKSIRPDYYSVAEALAMLEPKRMDRLVEIAKDMRANKRDLDVFVNGRPDEVDKIVKDIEEENGRKEI